VKISRNYFLVAGVIAAQLLHVASMQLPFMQDLLKIKPVTLKEWGIALGLALTLLIVMEIFKIIKHAAEPKKSCA
jgi:hypothetical protein